MALIDSITALHRSKNAAYGTSWKRRGEAVSIIANIARKVDRLEHSHTHQVGGTADENNFDTAVDLFVYVAKYCTYLAEQSPECEQAIFGTFPEGPSRRSDDVAAVEFLLHKYSQHKSEAVTIGQLISMIINVFSDLSDCFSPGNHSPLSRRLDLADQLAKQSWALVTELETATPSEAALFTAQWR